MCRKEEAEISCRSLNHQEGNYCKFPRQVNKSGEIFLPGLSMLRGAVISTLGLAVPWKFGKNFYGVLKKQIENYWTHRAETLQHVHVGEQCSHTLLEKGGTGACRDCSGVWSSSSLFHPLLCIPVPFNHPLLVTPFPSAPYCRSWGNHSYIPALFFVIKAAGLRRAKRSLGHIDGVEHGCALQVLSLNALLCQHLNPHLQLPTEPGKSPPDLFTCCEISIN